MKKKTVIVLICACAVLITGIAVAATQIGSLDMFMLGKNNKDKMNNKGKIVVKVANKEIGENEIDASLANQQQIYDSQKKQIMQNSSLNEQEKEKLINELEKEEPTKEKITDEIIRNRVIELEVEKLGIATTREQAKQEVLNNLKIMKEACNASDPIMKEQTEQTYQQRQDYMNGLGMNEEEYIEQVEVEGMLILMNNGSHLSYFKETIYKGDLTNREDLKAQYEQYLAGVIDSYSIDYLN